MMLYGEQVGPTTCTVEKVRSQFSLKDLLNKLWQGMQFYFPPVKENFIMDYKAPVTALKQLADTIIPSL